MGPDNITEELVTDGNWSSSELEISRYSSNSQVTEAMNPKIQLKILTPNITSTTNPHFISPWSGPKISGTIRAKISVQSLIWIVDLVSLKLEPHYQYPNINIVKIGR